jgi:hypothetical protein
VISKASLDEKPQSAAQSIREFIRAQRPPAPPQGLELQVQELSAALQQLRDAGKAPEKPLNEQQRLLQELQTFRDAESKRVQEAAEQADQSAYQERLSVLRSGALATLQARKEEYPALFALGQEELVVNELFSRLESDQDASEEGIAGEAEAGLREVWEKLNPIFAGQSKVQPAKSEPQKTITTAMSGLQEEESVEGLTRQQLIDRAWNKANS